MLTKANPLALAVKTNKSLVCAVTGILKPVVIPEDNVPTDITPVNAGANVTTAPGTAVNVLFGVVDW